MRLNRYLKREMEENRIVRTVSIRWFLSALYSQRDSFSHGKEQSLKASDVPGTITCIFFIHGEHNFYYSSSGLSNQAAHLETIWDERDRTTAGYPEVNANPGELKPLSNTFPSQKQLHKILSIKKIWGSHIKWYSFSSWCSLQLVKHFQIHSYFDPPKDGLV